MELKQKVKSSRYPGFGGLSQPERLKAISEVTGISLEKIANSVKPGFLGGSYLEGLIENYIGGYVLPIGIAPNFKINHKAYMVPMVIEESSVIAAAAYGAKLTAEGGGIVSQLKDNVMIGQVQFLLQTSSDFEMLQDKINDFQTQILDHMNQSIPKLVDRGGGVRMLYLRGPYSFKGVSFAIVQFDVDVCDAMGANTINTLAEILGNLLETMMPGHAHTRILSNLASKRAVQVTAKIPLESLGPEHQWENITRRLHMTQGFAEVDPFRAATHNKGIMNGVDAVLIATGNDWRANEAGAHAYASLSGMTRPLSRWQVKDTFIHGEMDIPMQVGTVGGVTRLHPLAKLCLEIMDIQSGKELAEVAAAVGLAQNFGALRALAFEGIQEGHMKLHQKNRERHQHLH
jgi:hydroxymethylglutaryl-CoA reductase